jgi:tetratricopeptide (TPR) repeat protein
MTNPNYHQWPADVQAHYDKTAESIKKHGHTILGTVDGKGNLKRPFAYTLGASFSTGSEYLCFFPIKGKGIEVISGIMNKLIGVIQDGSLTLKSQILNDDRIYGLPIGMVILDDAIKEMVESTWPQQLLRDAFLAEFSTDDHQLVVLIASDKDGNLPWEPGCGSFWPDMCPPPLVATAQEILGGDDSLMRQLEEKLGIDEEIPAEEPAAIGEKEEDIGRAVYKKIITDLDAKHPDQKILPLLVNGQKHIDQDEYELAIDTYSELIKVFGWENWSDEDQIIFKSANIIWSKQGNDRMFPLFWAYYFRATAKYELEEYSGCISDYSTAIDIGLNIITYDSDGESTAASARSWTILAYNGRGLAKRSKDNYQDALDDFDEALKLCQDDDVHNKNQIYYNMGLTKKDMGDDKGAADAFTSSIELSPDEINPYYYRGLSRSQIREYDGAHDDFSHVIDNVKKEEHLDFNLKRTYLYRGILRIKIDDNEGALQDLTKAIEIDPEFARAYFGRGIVKQLTGNNQGAVDDFTQAIEKGLKEPKVYKYRGRAKESMGDTEGAKEDFEKFEELKGS